MIDPRILWFDPFVLTIAMAVGWLAGSFGGSVGFAIGLVAWIILNCIYR